MEPNWTASRLDSVGNDISVEESVSFTATLTTDVTRIFRQGAGERLNCLVERVECVRVPSSDELHVISKNQYKKGVFPSAIQIDASHFAQRERESSEFRGQMAS